MLEESEPDGLADVLRLVARQTERTRDTVDERREAVEERPPCVLAPSAAAATSSPRAASEIAPRSDGAEVP